MTDGQRARWDDIKRGFTRVQRLGGTDADPAARVMAELSVVSDRIGEVAKAIAGFTLPDAPTSAPASQDLPDLTPYLAKLDETLLALRELHAARLPISATPAPPAPAPDANLISRESYLINGTLIPLLRFMATASRATAQESTPIRRGLRRARGWRSLV